MNAMDKWTEARLKRLERDLRALYVETSANVEAKAQKHFEDFDFIAEGQKKALKEGKITRDDYNNWCLNYLARGQKWDAQKEELARMITNANKIASAYINDGAINVYGENYNYTAYSLERYDNALDFALYDQNTIRELTLRERQILPHVEIDETVDVPWNMKKLQNALTRGILAGDSVGRIASSFEGVVGMNRNSALRNARTAVTGAQNAGRQSCYEAAEDMGIELMKEWMATHDNRTRDSHAHLDGVRVGINDAFPNGLWFPADVVNGRPEEIYNCRCTTRAILKDINEELRTDNTIESYYAWKAEAMYDGIYDYDEDGEPVTDKCAKEKGLKFKDLPRIKIHESIERSNKNANPKYFNMYGDKTTNKAYTKNCQRSIVAFEMRQRGYRVTASARLLNKYDELPKTFKNGKVNENSWVGCFKGAHEKLQRIESDGTIKTTKENLYKFMEDSKTGARFAITVKWKSNNAGHVLIGVNDGEGFSFYSPQTAKKYNNDFLFERAKPDLIYAVRIDNLKLTGKALECVEEEWVLKNVF